MKTANEVLVLTVLYLTDYVTPTGVPAFHSCIEKAMIEYAQRALDDLAKRAELNSFIPGAITKEQILAFKKELK
jgi:hypothetical protein